MTPLKINTEVGAGAQQPGGLEKDQLYIQHNDSDNKVVGIWAGNKADAIKCILPLKVVYPGDGNDYAMKAEDKYVGADTTSSVATITLPDPAKIEDGHEVIIEDEGGNGTANNVTIDTPGSETTDVGSITADSTIVHLMWDEANTNWKDVAET